MTSQRTVSLTPGKRVLFLTKDLDLIGQQLRGEIDLKMEDLSIDDLLDDINTDVMTPAWVCFNYRPEDIATNAYAGLLKDGERVVPERALMDGNFEVIVSGQRKGTGSSRETAPQCERWSGIRVVIAASFAPIHERNNLNLGQILGNHDHLRRLQAGEEISLDEFTARFDPVTRVMIECGGLFPFAKALGSGELDVPRPTTAERPMTMAEKIVSRHLVGGPAPVAPGDAVMVSVDGGYSHEFTTAQVHHFLQEEYGKNYAVLNPDKFAVFEDHLLYADGVKKFAPFLDKIATLRTMQTEFLEHTGVRDYQSEDGVSPGICHEIARRDFVDPGDFIQATDSHTCMGGGNNALTYGVGATEYASLVASGSTFVKVPESVRFELTGELPSGVTAKDVMLHILLHYARNEVTLDRVMEFGGPGLATLSLDERATLANMATECTAKSGICDGDEALVQWLKSNRGGVNEADLRARLVLPDVGAHYDGGVHTLDLSAMLPMVADPGDPDQGIPSDPTNGAFVSDIGDVSIDIAYGGSCTAGKVDDFEMYARVCEEALDAGRKVADGVEFYIQFGSAATQRVAAQKGWLSIFEAVGAKLINPGCGACIGCGPGVSESSEQVTVSAINRNFQGRSGPGSLYLASPLTVAASAIAGRIVSYEAGMFS
ncbi:MAG: 3-isopropylmalate/(R)-2-methylmalate dehydratase large subunit [Pseudohongiellaceae bacterium]|jgi:3-isopropylmalate/(R)-2-methylmalate dehydratase large subunit